MRWSGSAIECRIYAEDPGNHFLPSPGKITHLREPSGPGMRLDSGVYPGWTVPFDYDPLLAKLAAWGPSRERAIGRMDRALAEYSVAGIRTNTAFFREILADAEFREGRLSTAFLEGLFARRGATRNRHRDRGGRGARSGGVVAATASARTGGPVRVARRGPRRDAAVKLETVIRGRAGSIAIIPLPHGRGSETPVVETFRYEREDGRIAEGEFSIEALDSGAWSVLIGGRCYRVEAGAPGEPMVNGAPLAVELFDPRASRPRHGSAAGHGRLNIAAPMPGKVVRVLVSQGDAVEEGQGVVVVEAMKMQNEMKSPKTGRVVEVRARPDSAVGAGEVLMVVE